MNLEEAKRLSNVKVITAAYLLAGLTGQQELNPSRWPALVSHFIDEIKKRTGADWLSMPKGAYEKGDSVSRESITQSEFLQLLADYPVQSATAHPQAAAPAPVADSASDAPVDGITTAQVAAIFDGIKYRAENWTRRLSDTKWLEPAKVALGAQGGASSLWNPATLARLIHGKERGTAKQKTLEALNRKFKSKPVLAPWRTAWDEHYDMFKDADGSH